MTRPPRRRSRAEPRPPLYDTTLYLIEDRDGEARTRTLSATYYALPVPRLMELMREAGFTDVRQMDGVFFQPLVIGRGPHPGS